MITVGTAAVQTRLATLAEVEAELGIGTADASMLGVLLDGASAAIASYCHRTFGVQTLLEQCAGSGAPLLQLTCAPLVAVTTVTEDSTAITDYQTADGTAGILYRELGWARAGVAAAGWGWGFSTYTGGWDREAWDSGYLYGRWAPLRYAITYQAGWLLPIEGTAGTPSGGTAWPPLPADVTRAALQTTKAWYEGRAGLLVQRKRVADVQLEYNQVPVDELAPGVKALLQPYRRGTYQ